MLRRLPSALTVIAIAAALAPGLASADDGPWVLRVRALRIATADKSGSVPVLGLPEDSIHVSSKWAPDLDGEYFFTPSWSTELLLTVPQRHDVTLQSLGAAGTFKHLPPTLTAKYQFLPNATVRPYVGVGINVTFIMDANVYVPAATTGGSSLPLKLDRTSFGPAGQAGFDVRINEHWFGSVDAKYVSIRSDVKLSDGTKVSNVRIDPWLLGVGGGYRF